LFVAITVGMVASSYGGQLWSDSLLSFTVKPCQRQTMLQLSQKSGTSFIFELNNVMQWIWAVEICFDLDTWKCPWKKFV